VISQNISRGKGHSKWVLSTQIKW